MAGANMKDIRTRIKSVESTMQITKAMELVASSKLRKARERLENSRPYFEQVYQTMSSIVKTNREFSSVFLRRRGGKKACYVIIAGDRGLAGGYNANILKYACSVTTKENSVIIPLGRKASEYFEKRDYNIIKSPESIVENIGLSDCFELSRLICERYRKGEFDEVYFLYSGFISMLSQQPEQRKILPLAFEDDGKHKVVTLMNYDPSAEKVFETITPQYIAGLLYGAVCESFASEQAARRLAMESASDNAEDIIAQLGLLYNRARQAAITQEISEIVSGANALA